MKYWKPEEKHELNDWDRQEAGKAKQVRLVVKTSDMAKLFRCNLSAIRRRISYNKLFRSKNVWSNFWELVEYLESKGMRPKKTS